MSDTEQDELRLLRARAYGPDADIEQDAAALRRLHDLEAEARSVDDEWTSTAASSVAAQGAAHGPDTGAAREPGVASTDPGEDGNDHPVTEDDAAERAGDEHAAADPPPPMRRWGRSVLAFVRTRRGARVSIAVASALIVLIVAVVVLTVVQRVQTAPLLSGAAQVARLDVDDRFEVPDFYSGGRDEGVGLRGYEEFAGLRAMVSPQDFAYSPTGGQCIIVIQTRDLAAATDNSFPGRQWGGCGAGAFPATTQFVVTSDFSDETRDAFPEGMAVQFVYDPVSDEVVVFQAPPAAGQASSVQTVPGEESR